jgi:hypothetical protein
LILPDHVAYGCPVGHDPKDFVVYTYRDGRTEKRCLACRRERNNEQHNGGDRCRKAGHLKTPYTWRRYGPKKFGRCLPCQYARQVEKRDAKQCLAINRKNKQQCRRRVAGHDLCLWHRSQHKESST